VLVARCCEISRCDGGFSILVHIWNRRREMAAESLACLASAEKGRTNANFGCALAMAASKSCDMPIESTGQVVVQLRLQLVAQFAQIY